jgi:hypothetical protein
MPAKVTGRRGSLLPRLAATSVASCARRVEMPRPGRNYEPRVMPAEAPRVAPPARDNAFRTCGQLGHWARDCRQPRRTQAHIAQAEEEPTLLMAHVSIDLPPAAPATTALLHLDEPKAHALLGDGSDNDKTDGWCLDTGATHHMTGRREFFTELDSDVRGSVKFGSDVYARVCSCRHCWASKCRGL